MVQQVTGTWKVKAENLRQLNSDVKALLRNLQLVKIISVPREQNREADKMGNLALDKNALICDETFRPVIQAILGNTKRPLTLF
jgi:hypothetical protein